MTADDFRRLALSMHDAIESAHMGHPDFRANGKIFATLDSNQVWGCIKLAPEEQRELLRMDPQVFVPAGGAWGRQGWTKIKLDAADRATVRGAVTLAWEGIAAARKVSSSRSVKNRRARLPRKRK